MHAYCLLSNLLYFFINKAKPLHNSVFGALATGIVADMIFVIKWSNTTNASNWNCYDSCHTSTNCLWKFQLLIIIFQHNIEEIQDSESCYNLDTEWSKKKRKVSTNLGYLSHTSDAGTSRRYHSHGYNLLTWNHCQTSSVTIWKDYC